MCLQKPCNTNEVPSIVASSLWVKASRYAMPKKHRLAWNTAVYSGSHSNKHSWLISHKAVASAWRNWHKQFRALVEALQAWQTHRTAMVDEWRYPPRILSRWSHQLHEHCLFWQQLNNIPKYSKDACDIKHKVDQAMTLSSIEQAARASQRAILNWFWDQQSIDIN